MDNFNVLSFKQKAEEYEKAVNWLSELGLLYEPTRIGRYKKDIFALEEAYNKNTIDDLIKKRKYPDLINSLTEVDQLTFIYRGLGKIKDPSLIEKLRRFIKGPEHSSAEHPNSASRIGRDIEFELYIASHFEASGLHVDFGTAADLKTAFDSTNFFVECKRPSSMNSLKVNIDEAFDQLTKRCDSSDQKARGCVALSISKIINPSKKRLVADTSHILLKELALTVEKFIRENKHLWQKKVDTRTLGVLVHFQTAGLIESRKLPTSCDYFGVNNTTLADSLIGGTDDICLSEIVAKLEKGQLILHSI